jgi:tetratricopeptide (TPR) repeat protein
VVVIGGEPGAAMPPSPFEYWYSAIPAAEAGDHARAAEIVAEGLEHYPDHGTIHYALACELAMDGRGAEALEHLRVAFANDPRTRGWAESDSELDSLRDDPRWP